MINILKVLLLFSVFAFFSCNKKEIEDGSITWGKYTLMEIEANEPVDINLDGVKHTDLKKEIGTLNTCALFLYGNKYPSVDLLWPEPLINQQKLLQELPCHYSEGMKIDYDNESIQYYVDLKSDTPNGYVINRGQKIANDASVYTFEYPEKMIVNTDKQVICFETTQTFLTQEGCKSVLLKVRFGLVH